MATPPAAASVREHPRSLVTNGEPGLGGASVGIGSRRGLLPRRDGADVTASDRTRTPAVRAPGFLAGIPRWLGFPPLFLFLALAGGCESSGPEATTAAPAPPPIPVKAARPTRQTVQPFDEYTGRIEAVETVEVRARVSGYLDQVNFKDGDKVKKGDLLFTIDARPYQAELDRTVALLEAARTRLERARNEQRRAEHLWQNKAISEEEWDARGKAVLELQAAVRSAEAALTMARLNLEFTRIRSPIAGRIGRELITAGNLVNADQTALATIVSLDPVYVYFDADERAVLHYRRLASQGQRNGRIPAELALVDETGYPHHGYIDYVEPRLDPATGTLRIRAVFANPKELLSPGLFARLRIRAGDPEDQLLIPDRAIGTDQGQKFVWVALPDGSVDYRKVSLGKQLGSLRAIREGIGPEDEVVIEGIQKLHPGAKVRVERETLPAPGSQN